MRQISRKLIVAAMLATAWLAVPAAAPAQTGDSSTLRQPRNNVRGGSLSEGRPGNWIARAKGVHIDRQRVILKDFGGATYRAADETPSRQQVFALGAVEAFFDFLNDLANKLKLALTAQQALGT